MKMKKGIGIRLGGFVLIAVLLTILVGLSRTRDGYVCHSCKSLGWGKALRVFGYPVFKTRIKVERSLTQKQCKHEWEWYSASSTGILLNKEDWDGPIGALPYAEEFEKQAYGE
jgi:hypothetical protein